MTPASHRSGRARQLVAANLLLVALLVVHTLDHLLRQEAPVPAGTATAGTAGFVAVLLALGLSLAGHGLAPAATALVGFATAAGFVAIHVFPEWSVFSQPYADIEVDGLSWAAMIVPALAGAGVGAIGVQAARSQQFAAAS
jgi:hypothetical protein